MKRVVFVLGLMLFACSNVSVEETGDQRDVRAASSVAPESAAGSAVYCESAGGTCRKSRCRSNEVSNWDLECGTDAQCCVPVQ